ncbi:MAG: hypothetical protein AAGB19_12235 [Cyanobacteria bacterium P01_F01_bin.3]
MNLPVVIDIALGLAFIYLLLSLLASEIQELIATILQWRAKHLKDAIVNLFASDVHSEHSIEKAHQLTKQVYQHPLIRGINQESKGFFPNLFRRITWLLSRLYQWVTGRTEGEFGDRRTAPSYSPREAFATALLEQLGTKYFMERLVEAKFSEFVDLILEEIGHAKIFLPSGEEEGEPSALEKQKEEAQNKAAGLQQQKQYLENNLRRIEEEFIKDRIDLESAVNSIQVKLNGFLETDIRGIVDDGQLEALKDWKARVFVDDLERVIKNAGLQPTLQEIVDSIDKDSKTYQTYKQRFSRYEQERFEEVRKDFGIFEGFLFEVLKNFTQKGQEAAVQYRFEDLIIEQLSPDLRELEPQKLSLRRSKKSMSQIERQLITALSELEASGPCEKIDRQSIRAFREGFAGTNDLSSWQDFWAFQEEIWSQIVPFCLLFLLGILLAVMLSGEALPWLLESRVAARNLLIGQGGGWLALAIVLGIPLLWFKVARAWHTRKRAGNAGKTLAEIFDNYSVDELTQPLAENLPSETLPAEALQTSEETAQQQKQPVQQKHQEQQCFSQDIAQRLEQLKTQPVAVRYREVKDLGRSFRRYYLKLILENADIDLPFVPTSIKQSLAVLIRRSKLNARQAEDQILQLKSEVESWYDRSMERASGVYRRNAKGISILIGIALAVAVNANSIHILDQLAFDDALRQTVAESVQQSFQEPVQTEQQVAQAETGQAGKADSSEVVAVEAKTEAATEPATETEQDKRAREREALIADLEKSLDDINLPLGWDPQLINEEFGCPMSGSKATGADAAGAWRQLVQACLYENGESVKDTGITGSGTTVPEQPESFFYPTAIAAIFLQNPLIGLKYVLGWLITGVAISMGASFWFDLLSKLVKVRNTGRPVPMGMDVVKPEAATAATAANPK